MIPLARRNKVKISVLRRYDPSEVFESLPATPAGPLGICEIFEDGQEFIVDENGEMPEGFCSIAWYSIFLNVRTLAFGGDMPWFKEKGVAINCCIDGLRPVIFKLERI
jgi:uncharacterized repeat protein (TIGR04076 family)